VRVPAGQGPHPCPDGRSALNWRPNTALFEASQRPHLPRLVGKGADGVPARNVMGAAATVKERSPRADTARRSGAGVTRLSSCTLIDLPKVQDPRGNLTFVESGHHLPFKFNRVFYLYDVPGGSDRGGHALKTQHQFIIAIAGSFDVVLDAGHGRQRFQLNRSYYGLYVPPMVWRELENFSSGSVALVLASGFYDEADYIRDHGDFQQAERQR